MAEQEKKIQHEDWPIRGSIKGDCPNRHNHVSAFPASDRKLCPDCNKVYIRKMAYVSKGETFDPKELEMGTKVEMEHDNIVHGDKNIAAKIALDHLRERPDYYSRLKEMEASPIQKSFAVGDKVTVKGGAASGIKTDKSGMVVNPFKDTDPYAKEPGWHPIKFEDGGIGYIHQDYIKKALSNRPGHSKKILDQFIKKPKDEVDKLYHRGLIDEDEYKYYTQNKIEKKLPQPNPERPWMGETKPMKEVHIKRVEHPFNKRKISYGAFDDKGEPLYMGATDVDHLKRNIKRIRPVRRFIVEGEQTMKKDISGERIPMSQFVGRGKHRNKPAPEKPELSYDEVVELGKKEGRTPILSREQWESRQKPSLPNRINKFIEKADQGEHN